MSEELWPLPSSWKWAAFRDVADVELELVDAKRFPDAIHIAPNHLESGTGRLLETGTVAGDRVAGPQHRFVRGHLLYSKIRPYLAKAAIAPCDGFCSSDRYPIRPRFSSEFLLNWLVSPAFTHRVSRDQNRTVLPKANLVTLRELPIPLAPFNEQRRIVAKLEALQTRSRRAREALDAVPPLLEKFRQSILAAAFRGDLTKDWRAKNKTTEPAPELLKRIRTERRKNWEASELAKLETKGKLPSDGRWKERYQDPKPLDVTELPQLPHGWCWASVDELLSEGLANGRSVPTGDAGFPVLRLTALKHGQIDLSERKGGAWSADDAAPFLVRLNDFLVSRGNGSLRLVGRGGLVEEEPDAVAFPDTLIRIRVNGTLDRRYLAQVWSSRVVRAQIERAAKTTAGIFKVSQGDLECIAVPVPTIEEQAQIVASVDAMLDRVRALELTLNTALPSLASLERAILSKAFRGEFVPQDPNDEPAEAMLNRVASTNGAAPTNGSPPKRGRSRSATRAEQPND